MKAIIFDTETTGLCKPMASDLNLQPQIIEFFAYKVEHVGNEIIVVDQFEALFRPMDPVSDVITKITGIDNEMLIGQPTFAKVYPRLAEFFLGVERMVAHNLSFDRNMLLFDLARIDKQLKFPWPIQHVCTVEKSMHYEQRRLNLQKLHQEMAGIEFTGAHRAKSDVDALLTCYREMCRRGDIL